MQKAGPPANITGMGRTDRQGGRTRASRAGPLTHDAAIVRAALRALGRNRSDLVTLLIGIPLLALIARDWAVPLSPAQHRWLAAGIGAAIGFMAATQALGRLAYHATDGILAAPAQHWRPQARLAIVILGTALAIGLSGLAILGVFAPDRYLIGFAVGAVSAAAAGRFRLAMVTGQAMRGHILPNVGRSSRTLFWLTVVLGAATGVALTMLPVTGTAAAALAALVAFAAGTALGPVDAELVGYLTMIGRTSRAIIGDRIARPLAFLVPLAGALAVGADRIALIAGMLAAGAVPLLIALRVLAYRLFGRRAGDWFIGILLAVAALALALFPPLAPVVLLVGLVRLARGAAPKRWLIA